MNILLLATQAPIAPVDSLFTVAALATLAGATGAVYVICSTIQNVFNYNPKWLALLISIIISCIVAFVSETGKDPAIARYFIALLNGCLIFTTATGANTMIAPKDPQGGSSPKISGNLPKLAAPRTFTTGWWTN